MKYFELLGFKREPFSSSPDPTLFYLSSQHHGCLQELELAVRLRRGLSVVIGPVGTGKSTLCRRLLRDLGGGNNRKNIFRLCLHPDFNSPEEFLTAVIRAFGLDVDHEAPLTEREMRDRFKSFLFVESFQQGKQVLLIIDEGQKMPDFCLEILREFLNYETNDQKLLQVLIFAQEEFCSQISGHDYFRDRIHAYLQLRPLSFKDTRALINFRLQHCRQQPEKGGKLFTLPALWLIHRHSRGYPRRIVTLCSRVFLARVAWQRAKLARRSRIGFFSVLSCLRDAVRREQWAPRRG